MRKRSFRMEGEQEVENGPVGSAWPEHKFSENGRPCEIDLETYGKDDANGQNWLRLANQGFRDAVNFRMGLYGWSGGGNRSENRTHKMILHQR